MKKRIYLDNNATTPIDPRVLEVVADNLKFHFGNPSSPHSEGQESRSLLLQARDQVASYLKVKSQEIIFTSSGTEALNMVIRGSLAKYSSGHIISSSAEHSAVYNTLQSMQKKGFEISFLSPGTWGAVTPEAIESAIQPQTRFIVIMAVNNETGVKTDIEAIARIASKHHIPLIVDGVSWLGKESITIYEGISAACFSGHKIHAPKGIGFAYLRSSLKIPPLITGGDQEYGKRAGTENLSGIVGLAEAMRILKVEGEAAIAKMDLLRLDFENKLTRDLQGVSINGSAPRTCNTSNLAFEGIEGESLLTLLDLEGISVSHGSACSSGALEPSRILLNMGLPLSVARTSLRFSLSRFTTQEEINQAVEVIIRLVNRLRGK